MAYGMDNQNLANVNKPIEYAQMGQAQAVRERAAIDMVTSNLQDRIENLRRLAQSVDVRFSPVLRAVCPQPPHTGSSPAPAPAVSPIGSLLSEYCSSLYQIEEHLESILSRCEV